MNFTLTVHLADNISTPETYYNLQAFVSVPGSVVGLEGLLRDGHGPI